MELSKAKEIAAGIVAQLAPYCERIEVAGSIRRGRPEVHDIDIVAIPDSTMAFYKRLDGMGKVTRGEKIITIALTPRFNAEIYLATMANWATLLLIRTGSKDHNIKLCQLAKSKGFQLHADGSGLEWTRPLVDLFTGSGAPGHSLGVSDIQSHPIICNSETDIFNALGLNYKAPGERG